MLTMIPATTLAQTTGDHPTKKTEKTDNNSLNDPLGLSGNEKALQIIIGRVINASLGIVGSLALLMFVYSGLLLITSAGNQVVRRNIKTQTTEINNVIKTQPQIMIVN